MLFQDEHFLNNDIKDWILTLNWLGQISGKSLGILMLRELIQNSNSSYLNAVKFGKNQLILTNEIFLESHSESHRRVRQDVAHTPPPSGDKTRSQKLALC